MSYKKFPKVLVDRDTYFDTHWGKDYLLANVYRVKCPLCLHEQLERTLKTYVEVHCEQCGIHYTTGPEVVQ